MFMRAGGHYHYTTSSMHNMFGASVSEVYKIIRCQFDLKIDNLIGNKKETNGCI